MRRILPLILAILFLLGCEPTTAGQQVSAVEQEVTRQASLLRLTRIVVTATPGPHLTPAKTVIRITATPTPTVTSTFTITSTPTNSPTPTQPTYGNRFIVANTDGDGVYIRRSPDLADRIKAWPDNTEMVEIASTVQIGGLTWRNVRDPDGNEGFVPDQYLATEDRVRSMTAVAKRAVVATMTRQAIVSKRAATSTAWAKATARVTNTPRANISNACTAATKRYVGQLDKAISGLPSTLVQIGARIQQFNNQPSVFYDSAWQQGLRQAAGRLVTSTSNIALMDDPRDPLAARINEHVIEFMHELSGMASYLTTAASRTDTGAFQSGIKALQRAQRHWQQADQLIKRHCGR